MLELLFIFTIIICAIYLEESKVMVIVLVLLPFQSLLKSIFDVFGGSNLMAVWKEIAIIIIIIRIIIYNTKTLKIKILLFLLVNILFVGINILYFLMSDVKSDAIISAKMFITPLLYGICAYGLTISNERKYQIARTILIASIVVFIVAHVQQYLLKQEFALLMGLASAISNTGDIIYSQTASKITNIERMYGSFIGPNELGLYCVVIIGLSYYMASTGERFNKLPIISFIFGCITLIQTYSRVSWFMITIILIIISLKLGIRKNTIKMLAASTILFLCILMGLIFFPKLGDIFISSITLQEASAQDRPREFIDGLMNVLSNPLGYGLGLVSYRSASQIFHTEIFWWIIFLEIGVLGGLILFFEYIFISYIALSLRLSKCNVFTITAGAVSFTVLFAGFGSAIILEPIFLSYLWTFIGLGMNNKPIRYCNGK